MADIGLDDGHMVGVASRAWSPRTAIRWAQATGPILLLGGLYATVSSLYFLGATIVIIGACLIIYALLSESEAEQASSRG